MHNRRLNIASAMALLLSGVAAIGDKVLASMAHMPAPASFGSRYGGNPARTSNGGQGRGAVARSKRAAKRRANIRKHPRSA